MKTAKTGRYVQYSGHIAPALPAPTPTPTPPTPPQLQYSTYSEICRHSARHASHDPHEDAAEPEPVQTDDDDDDGDVRDALVTGDRDRPTPGSVFVFLQYIST